MVCFHIVCNRDLISESEGAGLASSEGLPSPPITHHPYTFVLGLSGPQQFLFGFWTYIVRPVLTTLLVLPTRKGDVSTGFDAVARTGPGRTARE
jgi:hypothetical protein